MELLLVLFSTESFETGVKLKLSVEVIGFCIVVMGFINRKWLESDF